MFHQFQQIVFLGRPVDFSTPEETPTHRLGTYYLETGYGVRPSKVTYDRKHSAITEYDGDGRCHTGEVTCADTAGN